MPRGPFRESPREQRRSRQTGDMKLPRVECPGCGRDVAVAPAAGQLTKGHLWRHDHPGMRRDASGDLVSCSRSLEFVDLPAGTGQLVLDLEGQSAGPASDEAQPALF